VVPSRVIGGFEILGKGKIFPRLGQKLIIKYGRPIEMSELDPGFEAENRYEVIAERILSAISDL
jgi:hypothetical protein